MLCFDGIGGHSHQIAAIVKRADFDVGRQETVIELLGFLFDAGEHVLGLLAAKHQNHAFDHVVIILKAELSQARGVADADVADILNAHGNAVIVAHDDVADVFGVLNQTEAAHIEKLTALRIKAATGVRVIGLQRCQDLRDGDVIAVDFGGIEQHLVLHGGAAETRIVGHAGDGFISPLDHPILEGLQLLGAAVGALDHVAINQARGTAERRHAGHDSTRQRGVSHPLKDDLAGEIIVGAFFERHDDVGKAVERDRTHHLHVRDAVHLQFERQGHEALDLLGRMPRPLGNDLGTGRR